MPPRSTLLLAALLAVALPQALHAATAASDWQDALGARTRLVAASLPAPGGGTRLVAGLEVELEPGWKTYWRTPGDSGGMPPELDWDQSVNIATATLHYPAPHRFEDAAGISVGYKERLVLPLDITPRSAASPVELKLGAVLGVCKDICVPVEAEHTLVVSPDGASDPKLVALLARFRGLVPATEAGAGSPTLEKLFRSEANGRKEIVALVRFPEGAGDADLFAESEDLSYLPVPVRDGEENGLARFRIDLSKADAAAAAPGRMLILTLVSSAGSIEVRRSAD